MEFKLNKISEILTCYEDLFKNCEVRIGKKYIEIYKYASGDVILFEIIDNKKLKICFKNTCYYTNDELDEIMNLFTDLKESLRK